LAQDEGLGGQRQPWPLYPQERELVPTLQEEKWPQGRSRRVGKISPLMGLDSRTVQPDRPSEPNSSSVSHERPEKLWKLARHVGKNIYANKFISSNELLYMVLIHSCVTPFRFVSYFSSFKKVVNP